MSDKVKEVIHPRNGHYVQNRKLEIALGALFFIIGALLIHDAFDDRGKDLPWPFSILAPW